MIERISELDWASFERQLMQKCSDYKYPDIGYSDLVQNDSGSIETDDGMANPTSSSGMDLHYWQKLVSLDTEDGTESETADVIYGIQQQIVYNADAMLGLVIGKSLEEDPSGRYYDKEVFFWNDLALEENGNGGYKFIREGYENSLIGRHGDNGQGISGQIEDDIFASNPSFADSRIQNTWDALIGGVSENDDEIDEMEKQKYGGPDEEENNLSYMPKLHSGKSLIEISEYIGPEHPEAKHSNYVSRKVSMAWFFNVIKAIVDLKRVFPWIIIGKKVKTVACIHDEAENQPDEVNMNTSHGEHTFLRAKNPKKEGSIKVYGNAQFNGEVSTFHSEVRFHDEVRVWDTLNVYGQSNFSKDINGTAMHVRWGDIAEYYAADAEYEPGTLVKFGGENEITVADKVANAVVTSKPGILLNNEGSVDGCPVAIALSGRVPVKVWGKFSKFDVLTSSVKHPGWAEKRILKEQPVIGRALEDRQICDCTSYYKKGYSDLVLCVVSMSI